MIQINNVWKSFATGLRTLNVLQDISLSIGAGETCAVVGPSGSGKTTLLGCCAGLDRPTQGTIILNGAPLHELDEDALAILRNNLTGYVFQSFRLLPSLTALENIMVPAEIRGDRAAHGRAEALLEAVGLRARAGHYPAQLSGGEQQRIALARAFINQPQIIFADEPTGNLDAATGQQVLDLLFALNEQQGTTLLLVTHDSALTRRVQRVITLHGGRIVPSGAEPAA